MKLHISPAALQDLKDIKNYISYTLCNHSAAIRIVKNIITSYLKLADSPFIGISLRSKVNFDTPYRYIISGSYLVFYQINHETVEILRVIYARRDYIKILFNIDCEKIEKSSENAPE